MPSKALSPSVMLATHMHAQPGVYALLLGSGVSTGAGMPTAWGVVKELIRRVAAAADPESGTAGDEAAKKPEKWWADHRDTDLGYSELLETLGTTQAVRQNLLEGFFEPSADERDQGIKVPSKAHKAIAELVNRGYVKVILTTNFDRLIEQALEEVGVAPQVISSPDAVAGMKPLAHADATVIKIHGDYLDLGTRNTVEELSDYPTAWKDLLRQVFDDYGLVISGWSAEWDKALVDTMQSSPNRRYPLYWDQRSSTKATAHQILANRDGQTIDSPNADEMFADLLASLDALERLAAPPLTTAMAVARLKQYLPDPVRRIDLHDLVMNTVTEVASHIRKQPTYCAEGSIPFADIEELWESDLQAVTTLTYLVATGIWHDQGEAHTQIWIDALQQLATVGTTQVEGTFTGRLDRARLWPALVLLTAAGVAATRRHRDAVLITLATQVHGRERAGTGDLLPAAQLLHPEGVIEGTWVNGMPRWKGSDGKAVRFHYPVSHLLLTDTRRFFDDLIPDANEFQTAFYDYEYRLGLIQERIRGDTAFRAHAGQYVGEWQWDQRARVPFAETRMLREADPTPWLKFLDTDSLPRQLEQHRSHLSPLMKW